MRLTKLLLDVPVEEIIYGGDSYERDIYAVCTDSRKIAENGLFVCLSGGNVDGFLLIFMDFINCVLAFEKLAKAEKTTPPSIQPY